MRLSLFAVAAFCVSSLAAYADTVYTYTGQNYTRAEGAYTTSDRVTGSFTVATPLAANLSNAQFAPESFTFSDGLITYAQSFTNSFFTDFATDANGNITQFHVALYGGRYEELQLQNYSGGTGDIALSANGDGESTVAGSFVTQAAAPAASAVTPEPSSLALLGTGMLGVVGMVRKRFV